MKEGQWMFERCGEETWHSSDCYDSKEEAINAGRKYFKELKDDDMEDFEEDYFQVGQISEVSIHVCPHTAIDNVLEEVYSEVGEVSDGWLEGLNKNMIDELGDRLSEAFRKWVKEVGEEPKFFSVKSTEDISLEEE